MHNLPETGFVRLKQILGDKKSDPPIPALIPIGKSQWWEGVKTGRFPAQVSLGPTHLSVARGRYPCADQKSIRTRARAIILPTQKNSGK